MRLPYVVVVRNHPEQDQVYTWLIHNMIVYPLASWQVQWQVYVHDHGIHIHTDDPEAHEVIHHHWGSAL